MVNEGEWELKPHPVIPRGKPLVLMILDGWGENVEDDYNAIYKANCPHIKALREFRPDRWRTIKAHGKAVGLPSDGDMGNSEVGHNAMGAGKVIDQGAALVDRALESGDMFKSPGFNYVKEAWVNGGTFHMLGLLSDGGVHSRYDQVIGTIHGAWEHGAKRIRVHVLTDGRDVPDGSSLQFVAQLEKDLELLRGQGCDAKIASGGGRMRVTMDRYEADWNIVERGWHAHVLGDAPFKFKSALEALKKIKEDDPSVNDQYYPPWVVVDDDGKPVGPIVDGDAVVIWNFRADRVIQISKAFEYPDFHQFDRVRYPKVHFAGMMQYDGDLKLPANFLVAPPVIEKTSGQYLVKNGVRTFACSETQKFGHVTFFWNGNRSGNSMTSWRLTTRCPATTAHSTRSPHEGTGDSSRLQGGDSVGEVRLRAAEPGQRRHGGAHWRVRCRARGVPSRGRECQGAIGCGGAGGRHLLSDSGPRQL
ncbi:hypothetical protein CLOM_g15324 [Closterium sp. NIES-68]|nr:hypothetical protein CLOM_g15324 [Closterium sp. NIES-68]